MRSSSWTAVGVAPTICAWIALAPVVACSPRAVSLESRPCSDGKCTAGLVCRATDSMCVRPLAVDCVSGRNCPTSIRDGQGCTEAGVGAVLACCEGALGCECGCRVCGADARWSVCFDTPGKPTSPGCTLGLVSSCATCTDDCRTTIANALPTCISTNAGYACSYLACHADAKDLDGDVSNGCECPATAEVCDGKDNDCDGAIDEVGAAGCTMFYRDADGDGFGASMGQCLCAPAGEYTATVGYDCDDSDALRFPGGPELCDGKDNNCDGVIPPSEGDGDGDGYVACPGWVGPVAPTGSIMGGGDCMPAVAGTNPSVDCAFGWYWESNVWVTHCGDGYKRDLEECDDGNAFGGDGCSSACLVEGPWVCTNATSVSPSVCRFPCVDGPATLSNATLALTAHPLAGVNVAGATTLSVASTAGFARGDELLLLIMTDSAAATCDQSGAGLWELNVVVEVVNGTTLSMVHKLVHSYNAAFAAAQAIRVPSYPSLTISGTVTAPAWNSATGTGGVFIVRAKTLTLAAGAVVDMTGAGYRGGTVGVAPEGPLGRVVIGGGNGGAGGASSLTAWGNAGTPGGAGINGQNACVTTPPCTTLGEGGGGGGSGGGNATAARGGFCGGGGGGGAGPGTCGGSQYCAAGVAAPGGWGAGSGGSGCPNGYQNNMQGGGGGGCPYISSAVCPDVNLASRLLMGSGAAAGASGGCASRIDTSGGAGGVASGVAACDGTTTAASGLGTAGTAGAGGGGVVVLLADSIVAGGIGPIVRAGGGAGGDGGAGGNALTPTSHYEGEGGGGGGGGAKGAAGGTVLVVANAMGGLSDVIVAGGAGGWGGAGGTGSGRTGYSTAAAGGVRSSVVVRPLPAAANGSNGVCNTNDFCGGGGGAGADGASGDVGTAFAFTPNVSSSPSWPHYDPQFTTGQQLWLTALSCP